MWSYEKKAWNLGYSQVAGVDEAGAGPLAGPVVAAAVILDPGTCTLEAAGVTDSKALKEKKREALYPLVLEQAVAYGIGEVSAEEIDRSDILSARLKAMSLALEALEISNLPVEFALIDGNRDRGQSWEIAHPHELIVKGDSLSLSIAAASVLAKVTRDRIMIQAGETYPEYGFAKHKGYGTKAHYEAIAQHKLCPLHRRSFLQKKWVKLGL